jgi:hypothetical protein
MRKYSPAFKWSRLLAEGRSRNACIIAVRPTLRKREATPPGATSKLWQGCLALPRAGTRKCATRRAAILQISPYETAARPGATSVRRRTALRQGQHDA